MKRTIKKFPINLWGKYIFQNFWLIRVPLLILYDGWDQEMSNLTSSILVLQVRIWKPLNIWRDASSASHRCIIGASSRLWHGWGLAQSWANKKQATSPRAQNKCGRQMLAKISCFRVFGTIAFQHILPFANNRSLPVCVVCISGMGCVVCMCCFMRYVVCMCCGTRSVELRVLVARGFSIRSLHKFVDR